MVFKRFFLQPYKRLCRNSLIWNLIMESGINPVDHKKDIRQRKALNSDSVNGLMVP
jgi:hypothetical protein